MYKPPENTNRVKSIKSKFENFEKLHDTKEKISASPNGTRDNLILTRSCLAVSESSVKPLNLQRQLSDPSKRNIKRTPAFRLDKNMEKITAFQRGSVVNKSQEYKHILKPISAPKSNICDISFDTSANTKAKSSNPSLTKENKPLMYKSKSSIDFKLIRSKFDSESVFDDMNPSNQRSEEIRTKNISALYTEPIPKSLRMKPCDNPMSKPIYSNLEDLTSKFKSYNITKDIHNTSTLKLTDQCNKNVSCSSESVLKDEDEKLSLQTGRKNSLTDKTSEPISALKKLDTLLELTKSNSLKKKTLKDKVEFSSELSDTLKIALKRPLPNGPAPKKPPRTFEHCTKDISSENNNDSLQKNHSFLHVSKVKDTEVTKPLYLKDKCPKRGDPKYMLNKLETALRNNKLKSKRCVKTDVSTTSGEDSDDNIFKNISKVTNNCSLPSVPDNTLIKSNNSPTTAHSRLTQALNFNCMNGYNCVSSDYTKLNESKSSFFIGVKDEEPLYAEPWHFEEGFMTSCNSRARSASSDRNSKNNRNSLYYMSSPVLCSTPRSSSSGSMNLPTKETDVPSPNVKCRSEKEFTQEITSSSSFSSDSSTSSPMDEPEKLLDNSIKIKHLIEVFENKTIKDTNHNVTKILPQNNLKENSDDLKLGNEIADRTSEDGVDANDFGEKDSNSESEPSPDKRKFSIEDPTVNKFRKYVRHVSVYAKTRFQKKSTLFDCCLIVEWNADVLRIKFKFPHDVQVPQKIEDLCFPDATSGLLDKTKNAQCYSLVITNDKGERTFGYCRRVIPEGSNKCLPIVYCILSKYRSPRFYRKILIELESRHGMPELHRNNLLRAFYFNKFPQPGETVTIRLNDNFYDENGDSDNFNEFEEENVRRNSLEDSVESNFVIVNSNGDFDCSTEKERNALKDEVVEDTSIRLNFHRNPIYENADLSDLHELPIDILQKILSSLLLERKVILISCLLSKLSSCVEALQTLIYPFTWPHTFIPVLPQSLWEFVETPTPIICGILSVEVINNHNIEDGIVVDLDEKSILKEEGDEDKVLCNSVLKTWRKSIAAAKTTMSDQEKYSFLLTDAYVRMFAVILKNYRDYIVNGNFQKEAYIRSHKSKGIRRFLKWFTDTTMFLSFVDEVITKSQNVSLFNRRMAACQLEDDWIDLISDIKDD